MTEPQTALEDAREQVEALIWEITVWRGERGPVDRVLAAIDRYASVKAEHIREAATKGRPRSSHPIEEQIADAAAQLTTDLGDMPSVIVLPPADAGKECRACGEYHVWSEFTRDRTRKDGYMSRCKKCVKGKNMIYNDHGPRVKERV